MSGRCHVRADGGHGVSTVNFSRDLRRLFGIHRHRDSKKAMKMQRGPITGLGFLRIPNQGARVSWLVSLLIAHSLRGWATSHCNLASHHGAVHLAGPVAAAITAV
jgi:hypothetical protein